MRTENTIKTLLENSPDGTITARQITESGMHRSILQKLVKDGELYRYGRGLYICLLYTSDAADER